jgi:hypothetical protein
MPHVVIEGPVSIEDIWMAYAPIQRTEGDWVFKTEDCYLSNDKTELLVRCMVVESGYARKFFVRLYQRDKSLTLKLEPLTDPEKTDAVRRLLGIMTEGILIACPEARVLRSTISPFLHGGS